MWLMLSRAGPAAIFLILLLTVAAPVRAADGPGTSIFVVTHHWHTGADQDSAATNHAGLSTIRSPDAIKAMVKSATVKTSIVGQIWGRRGPCSTPRRGDRGNLLPALPGR